MALGDGRHEHFVAMIDPAALSVDEGRPGEKLTAALWSAYAEMGIGQRRLALIDMTAMLQDAGRVLEQRLGISAQAFDAAIVEWRDSELMRWTNGNHPQESVDG